MYRLELPSEQAVDESNSSKSGCVRSLIGAPFFERPLHLLALFAARTNVSSEVEFIRQGSDLVIVVAFVEAEILSGFGRWFGSGNWDVFERLPRHFEVVPVCGCGAGRRPRRSILGGADRATRRSIRRWIQFWPTTGAPTYAAAPSSGLGAEFWQTTVGASTVSSMPSAIASSTFSIH